MRLGRVFNAANWKYAIGEDVLIVMGVTIINFSEMTSTSGISA